MKKWTRGILLLALSLGLALSGLAWAQVFRFAPLPVLALPVPSQAYLALGREYLERLESRSGA